MQPLALLWPHRILFRCPHGLPAGACMLCTTSKACKGDSSFALSVAGRWLGHALLAELAELFDSHSSDLLGHASGCFVAVCRPAVVSCIQDSFCVGCRGLRDGLLHFFSPDGTVIKYQSPSCKLCWGLKWKFARHHHPVRHIWHYTVFSE